MVDQKGGSQPGFLPNPINLAWGVGSLGTITMINSVASLYLFYLVGVVKISPALAGALIFASKIVDMVSDPAMGWISDRTNTRWGRRRPYMFIASLACPIAMIMLFSVPTESGAVSIPVYVELSLVFFALALTAFNVPYLAMPAEMTDNYHERSKYYVLSRGVSRRRRFCRYSGFGSDYQTLRRRRRSLQDCWVFSCHCNPCFNVDCRARHKKR